MDLLIIVLVVVAVIIACVVHVALRNRRGSGHRQRTEPTAQGAPFSQESGISQQGHWGGGSGGSAGGGGDV